VTAEGLRIDRYHCRTCLNWVCIEACPESALVRVGSEMTVEAVLQRVAKDRDFYRNSGGGVTFSGGEPYSQAPFLLALLRGCRELGVPTAVETCGFARGEDILETVPLVDLFLFDLKAMDPERSKALTGQDNALILKNLAMLAQRCPDSIVVRVALIPGATDDNPNIEAIAQFMLHHGLNRVHLEPYHTLGIEKYAGLGRSDAWEADPCDLTRERIQEIGRVFETQGIRWEVP
jgi:pyruvate formate lyase activating enzyme